MSDILSLVLGSMHADMARLDRVAMNLANVQTPGYKRQLAVTPPFAARVDVAGAGQPARGALHADQRPGTLKATGHSLDLALAGPGWFEIATEAGYAYTRQGSFRLDGGGRLVTQQGRPVMGIGGEIRLLHATPLVDAGGRVFDGNPAEPGSTPVGQLRIVQFDRAAPIELLGDGLVAMRGEASAVEGEVRVQQGFLENSNVNPVQEMVQLLQLLRHMETMQKVATSYDEMLGTSIRRLGEGA